MGRSAVISLPTADKVTTLASGVDGAIRRIATSYEVRGMVKNVTSYNDPTAGSTVNDVEHAFNTFAQLSTQYQEHSGAVNTGTSVKVQYAYANGSANTVRPTTITYPDGRVLSYSYGSGGGDGDKLSRVQSLDDSGSAQRVAYTYVGLGSFVTVDYPEPDVHFSLVTGSGVNPYGGLDKFSRIDELVWENYSAGTSDLVRLGYGYNRASSRTFRKDEVASAANEAFDELYGYDGMQRLVNFNRGVLNLTCDAITSDFAYQQKWQLDAMGNWKAFSQVNQDEPDEALDQTRLHNRVNEITSIARNVGQEWVSPGYDRNGNMTILPQPNNPTVAYNTVWDAWNRLRQVEQGGVTVTDSVYDGLNRRVTKAYSGTTQHFYYSAAWQELESRLGSSTNPSTQFIWGLRYIDDIVLRDRDTTGGGSLNERLYYMQDALFNVVALTDTSGTVQERYAYSPYGIAIFLNASWSPLSSSAFVNPNTYTGRRLEETGFLDYRMRGYDPRSGRFLNRDPIGHAGTTASLYEYVASGPINKVDPSGLKFVTCTFGADAVGAQMFTFNFSISPLTSAALFSINGSVGMEALFHCDTEELAEYMYVGIGLGIGQSSTSLFGVTINVGPFWVYNLIDAGDFTKHFVNVSGSFTYGLGLYAEVFTDPVDYWKWVRGGPPPTWGFGAGVSLGAPSWGISALYQYYWMTDHKIDKTLRAKYCCAVGGGAIAPNPRAAAANIRKASRVDLTSLVAKGKAAINDSGQFNRVFSDLPKGRIKGGPGPLENYILDVVRKAYPNGPVGGNWYNGEPLTK